MPRRKKSKLHIRKKHKKAQSATQDLRKDKEKPLSSSSPATLQADMQKKPGKRSRSTCKWPNRALSSLTKSAGVSCTKLCEGANCKIENKQNSSKSPPSTVESQKDPLTEMTGMLVWFLMQMYNLKQPIRKRDMLKIIHNKYKNRFLEILRRASFSIEVVFGVDLKEVDAVKRLYYFVNKMDLPNSGRVSSGRGFPKIGLLMNILGVIFLKGNRATEQKIWEFLNTMKVYAGKKHFIFGEPKKLITKDFVKLKYLEYRQVPDSDPPHYEFLWGPRAYAETSKMKVLEFLAKINQTSPSAFLSCYEEALQDEKERAQAKIPLMADNQCDGSE